MPELRSVIRNEQAVACDVLVLGEALVELASPQPLRDADVMRVSCSGDAMNAAAAAAAAGASVGLVTAVGDDELGERILRFAADRGIDTAWVRRRPEPNGIYFASGEAEFVYVRRGSAASKMGPGDLEDVPLRDTSALVVSGITQALSASCGAAVEAAAGAVAAAGGHVVYDPNFRRRLTTVEDARAALRRLAPLAGLVTPSCPDDTVPLLGTDDPAEAAVACRALGAGAVAVTLGRRGLLVEMGEGPVRLPPLPAPAMVDTTGAGDVLAGTTAARLALGDPLLEALRMGMAAAALSLAGAGGTGRVPTLDQSRALLHRHADTGARPTRAQTALRRGA
jgi:2-dehydro-3-deoxygluconokinase